MNDDLLRRLWHYLTRPEDPPANTASLDMVDERLDTLERKQREIHARLRLLERQSDPRRLRDDE